jgi:hypothetical protein
VAALGVGLLSLRVEGLAVGKGDDVSLQTAPKPRARAKRCQKYETARNKANFPEPFFPKRGDIFDYAIITACQHKRSLPLFCSFCHLLRRFFLQYVQYYCKKAACRRQK